MKSKIAVRAAARLGQELVSSNSHLMVTKNDPAAAVRESVATLRALEERAARLPLEELREAQFRHDAMAVQRIVRTALFG